MYNVCLGKSSCIHHKQIIPTVLNCVFPVPTRMCMSINVRNMIVHMYVHVAFYFPEVIIKLVLGQGPGVVNESRTEVRGGIDQEIVHVLVSVTPPGSLKEKRMTGSQVEREMVSWFSYVNIEIILGTNTTRITVLFVCLSMCHYTGCYLVEIFQMCWTVGSAAHVNIISAYNCASAICVAMWTHKTGTADRHPIPHTKLLPYISMYICTHTLRSSYSKWVL